MSGKRKSTSIKGLETARSETETNGNVNEFSLLRGDTSMEQYDKNAGPMNIWLHEKAFRQFIEKKMY